MAAVVFQKNKKTGVIYAYQSESYWDKEKQQSRARRVCIGKVDPVTKEIIPTRKRLNPSPGRLSHAAHTQRTFYGATYLLEAMGERLGIQDDLKRCFPETYTQMLSIVYYLILEDRNALSRFSRWAALHTHPCGQDIPSQRSSELFASITEGKRAEFFKLQARRRAGQEYWAYDTTSISSFSQCLPNVKFGKNKDHERLAQINLALLYGQESNVPFYYRKLTGNITDSRTLKGLLADLEAFGYPKVKLVMDRGFYSQANIDYLYAKHLKFLLAAKTNLKYVQHEIDQVNDTIRSWEYYHQGYDLYSICRPISWNYTQVRPQKGDELTSEKRMYMHIYYNAEQAVESERDFHVMLSSLQQELLSNKPKAAHAKLYDTYFTVKRTPKRGVTVTAKDEVLAQKKRYHGFFVLLSNEIKDPIRALEIYRNKDLVEKAFSNLKERLNFRRTLVSSTQSLNGKIFVQFIALIFLSYLKKLMQDASLFTQYTLQGLLDELDLIESYQYPHKKLRIGEMTEKQSKIYSALGFTPPASLQ